MERLKSMKECLMSAVQGQMANLNQVDTQELGAAVDMIKDLEEAIYYCTITKAMENQEKEERKNYYHDYNLDTGRNSNMYYHDRDLDRNKGRMYYTERNQEYEVPFNMRDLREGRSPQARKMYMESKEMHKDQDQKIKDLDRYMQELSSDITEMIEGASPEEKKILGQKISTLATKITNHA